VEAFSAINDTVHNVLNGKSSVSITQAALVKKLYVFFVENYSHLRSSSLCLKDFHHQNTFGGLFVLHGIEFEEYKTY
jgi:hypothetical protein